MDIGDCMVGTLGYASCGRSVVDGGSAEVDCCSPRKRRAALNDGKHPAAGNSLEAGGTIGVCVDAILSLSYSAPESVTTLLSLHKG